MSLPSRPDATPPAVSRRDVGLRASISQFLLMVRLRARTRRDLAVDTLERAAHVIFVTCKNWFFPEGPRADAPEKPGTTAAGPEEKDKPRS